MSAHKITRTTILCTAAFMAIPLFAAARPKPGSTQTEKKSIELSTAAVVDGKTLAPGKYEVLIEGGNKAVFEHNGQMVVTASCDWKTMPHKSPYDSLVTSSNNVLQEIDFQGSDQVLEVM
jgi:hypothetical protein